MKKKIARRLSAIILATTFLTLTINFCIQIDNAKDNMIQSSKLKINQIKEILKKNDEDLSVLTDSLKEDYTIRAKAAAYVIQHRPEIISSQQEIEKIAALLQVDELHIFDKEGRIYAGTEPQYFGYTFHSGEQMEFFLPMLTDHSLELVQGITPNTAEGKLMQYTAVWQEDEKNIIQIGMEPIRLMKAMEKNELSYIFSMVTSEPGTTLLVADKNTGMISGSTDSKLVGFSLEDVGIIPPSNVPADMGFPFQINNVPCFCVFDTYNDQLIGVLETETTLYEDVYPNMLSTGIYLILIALVTIIAILSQIDKYVIRGIDKISMNLNEITAGNLDTRVEVDTSPEFVELSRHINQMVESQLNTTEKLSHIFDTTDVPIGVFECTQGMNRVLVTRKVQTLLMLSDVEAAELFADKDAFERKLETIYTHIVSPYTDIYQLSKKPECYLQIMTFSDGMNITGIITDVTGSVLERRQLEHDRDYDLLTLLLNRRGFTRHMDNLFKTPQKLDDAVLLMVDMDHLKYINDNYGHAYGDAALQKIAALLKTCPSTNRVVARLSGDEFALFLYGETKEVLEKHIQEIHDRMLDASITILEEQTTDVRMSGGYIFYSDCHEGYSKMLGMADEAMYRAKKRRKYEFICWSKDQ